MPSWKKVITSGSNAALNHITSSGNISGSFQSTGSFGQLLIPQNGNATAITALNGNFNLSNIQLEHAANGGQIKFGSNTAGFFHSSGRVYVRKDAGFTDYAFKAVDQPGAAGFWVDTVGRMKFGHGYSNQAIFDMMTLGQQPGHASGSLLVSGSIIAKEGNISGSSTSTGSFGRLETAGRTSFGDFTVVPNNTSYAALDSGGNIRGIIKLDSSNKTNIGNATTSTGIVLSGNNVGIGETTPTELLHLKQTGNDFATIIIESTANDTGAGSSIHLTSNDGAVFIQNNSTARTVTRYGTAVGGFFEILAQNSTNGIMIGNGTTNKPIIFGLNNKEQLRISDNSISGSATSTGSFGSLTAVGDVNITANANNKYFVNFKNHSGGAIGGFYNADSDGVFNVFDSSGATRVSLHSDNNSYFNKIGGNLGLGTNNPTSLPGFGGSTFHINGTDASIRLQNNTGTFEIGADTNNDLKIYRDASNIAMIIKNSGNIGIGVTNPGVALEVNGSVSGSATSTGSFGSLVVADKVQGALRVTSGASGVATTDRTDGDDFIVENSDHGGISILTPDNKFSTINFGSPSDNRGAVLDYSHSTKVLNIGTDIADGKIVFKSAAGSINMTLDHNGNLGIGKTPTEKLDISGNIMANHISTNANGTGSFAMVRVTTGNISGSSTSTGSFGSLKIADAHQGDLLIQGDATTAKLKIRPTINTGVSELHFSRYNRDNAGYISYNHTADRMDFYAAGPAKRMDMSYSGVSINQALTVGTSITAGGNISGSSTSTGSFGRVEVPTAKNGVNIGAIPSNWTSELNILGTQSTTGIKIQAPSSGNAQIKFYSNNGGSNNDFWYIQATNGGTFDIVNYGPGSFTNMVSIAANTGNMTVRGNVSGSSTSTGSFGKLSVGNGSITTSGNMILDADGAQIRLQDGGTEFGRISRVSSDLVIKSISNNNDILFKGVDGGGTITALQLDMSEGGNAIFNGNVQVASGGFVFSAGALTLQSGAGTNLVLDAGAGADEITLSTSAFTTTVPIIATGDLDLYAGGGTKVVGLTTSAISLLKNTSISGNLAVDTNVLYVDSSANKVGINRIDPQFDLDVIGDIRATGDVIARRYVISSSVSHITSSFSSGSTIFGDTIADTHQFTGSLSITGSALRLGRSILSNVYQGNLVIGSNAPAIFLDDGDVSNLRHSIVGGGNAGLEIAADIHNATTGYINFGVGGSTVARMIEGGNVGIGTTSPESILHIADGSSGAIGAKLIIDNNVSDADGNGTEISFFNAAGASAAGVANSRIRSVASGNTNGYSQLQFWTYHASEAQRMVITSDGKVGIGTASPSKTFHAYANVSSDYAALVENDQATSGHGLQIHSDGNGSGTILFDVDAAGSSRFRVRGDGSVLVGFTTSQAEKLAVNGDFRATGNISGSATSTGSFGRLNVGNGGSTVQPRFRVADGVGSLPTMHPEQGDLAIFQNNANTSDISAIYTIAGTAGSSHYVFGDADGKNVGRVSYDHSSNAMTLHTNTTEQVRIDSSGHVSIGTTATNYSSNSTTLAIFGGQTDNSRAAIDILGSEVNANDALGSVNFWNVGSGNNKIGALVVSRDGADNSGKMLLQTANAGTNATAMTIFKDGKVGIGISGADGKLHVSNGLAGVVTAHADADELVIENSGNAGISILTPASSFGGIFFGSPDDNIGSSITFQDSSATLFIQSRLSGGTVKLRSGDGVDAVTIDSSQNVGIGVTSPAVLLHLSSSSANQFRIERSGTTNAAVHFKNASDDWYAGITSQQDFSISQNADIASGTEFRIQDSTGYVAIGNASPATHLHINGTHVAARGLLSLESTDHANINLRAASNSVAGLELFNGSNQKWFVGNRGNNSDKFQLMRGSDDAVAMSIDQSLNTEFGGHVSGSSISSASFGRIDVAGKLFVGGSQVGGGGGGGSADNLGNHTATQDLDLNSNSIKNVTHITGSGNISGSASSTASFGSLNINMAGLSNSNGDRFRITAGSSGQPAAFYSSNQELKINFYTGDGSQAGNIDIYDAAGNVDTRLNGGGDSWFTGDLGVGTTSPDGKLHVHTATAGTMTAHASADDLVVENSDHGGISILTPNNKTGGIYFGDVEDNNIGMLNYNHLTNRFEVTVAASSAPVLGINANTAEFGSSIVKISGSASSTGSFGAVTIGQAAVASRRKLTVAGGIEITQEGGDNFELVYNNGNNNFNFGNVGTGNHSNIFFYANNAAKMFISGSGNVGIGTTSPDYKLEVVDTGFNAIGISRSGYQDAKIGITNVGGSGDQALEFDANAYEFRVDGTAGKLVLLNNGKVGVGTTSPSDLLHVYKSGALSVEFESNTGNADLTINSGTDGAVEKSSLIFQANSTSKWEILKTNSGDFMVYDYVRAASVIDIGANSNMSLMANGGDVLFPGANVKVSGSSTSTGSFGQLYVDKNIRAQGDGNGVYLRAFQNSAGFAVTRFVSDTGTQLFNFGLNSSNNLYYFSYGTDSVLLEIFRTTGNFDFKGNNIYAGNVSGSASSTGSFARLIADGAVDSRVGIGTPSPVRSLDIHDGGANGFMNLRDSTKSLDIGTATHDMVRFYEGGDVRMTISGSNVGIGVQTPDSRLEVNGTDLIGNFAGSNAGFYIRNNTPNYISFQGYGDDGFIFKDGGNERIRFESGGNVGMGITAPVGRLHLKSTGSAPSGSIAIQHSGNTVNIVEIGQSDNGNSAGAIILDKNNGIKSVHIDGHGSSFFNGGNVGFGTELDPDTTIHLRETDHVYLTIESQNTGAAREAAIKYQNYTTGTNFWWVGMNDGNDPAYSIAYGSALSNGNTKLIVLESGNVGIGTTNPGHKLHVVGDIRATGDIIANRLVVSSSVSHITASFSSGSTIFGDTPDDSHRFTGSLFVSGSDVSITAPSPVLQFHDANVSNLRHRIIGGGNAGLEISADVGNALSNAYIRFEVGNSEKVRIVEDGSVGIGTTSPDLGLHVHGAGNSGRIKLQQTTASDYSLISYVTTTRQWNVGVGGNSGVASLQNNFFFQDVTSGLNSLILSNTTGDAIFGGDVSGSATSTGSFGNLRVLNASSAWASADDLIIGNTSKGVTGMTLQSTTSGETNIAFADGVEGNAGRFAGYIRYDHNATKMIFATEGSQRVFIDGSGNVGIGTASPGCELDIQANAGPQLRLKNLNTTNASELILDGNRTSDLDSGAVLFHNIGDNIATITAYRSGANNSGELRFGTRNAGSLGEHFRIDKVGKVAIGTGEAPNQRLDVTAGSRATTFDAADSDTWADVLVRNKNGSVNTATGIGFQNNPNYHTNASSGIAAVKSVDNNDYQSDLVFITRRDGATSTEKMRITHDGNVGIGNTSPSRTLDVTGDIGASTNIILGGAAYTTDIITRTGNNLYFKTSGGSIIQHLKSTLETEFKGTINVTSGNISGSAASTGSFGQLVIDGTGTTGNFIKGNTTIGTSTTYNGFPLNVGGNIYAVSGDLYVNDNFGIRNASDSDVRIRFSSTNGITMGNAAGNTILHVVDTTISGSAASTGSFGALTVPGQATIGSVVEASSIMYKENVKQIESPLEKITKLRGVEFDYKKTNEHSIGMIAEEVNEIFPELVAKNEDGDVTAMSYTRMTAVLLEAVKELSAEVKELRELNNYSKSGDKKK